MPIQLMRGDAMRIWFWPITVFLLVGSTVSAAERKVEFSGQTWIVRAGAGRPAPNQWSHANESVWGDDDGQLHLKIRHANDKWLCGELTSEKSFGYGEYLFQVGRIPRISIRTSLWGYSRISTTRTRSLHS